MNFSHYCNPTYFEGKLLYNNVITNDISFHAINNIGGECVFTLYDRKMKHFETTQTKLKNLLLVLKNYCVENNIKLIKFINENISHYHLDKFHFMLNYIFLENDWDIRFLDSISNRNIFQNVGNQFRISEDQKSNSRKMRAPFKTPFIGLEINEVETIALIDSGATSSIIDADFVDKHNIPFRNNDEEYKLFDVNGKPLSIKGICRANLKIGNEYFDETLFVVANAKLNQPMIICCPFLELHGFNMDFRDKTLYNNKNNIINWIPPDSMVYNEIGTYKLFLNHNISINPRNSVIIDVNHNPHKLSTNYTLSNCNKCLMANNCVINDTQVEGLFTVNEDNRINLKITNHSSQEKIFKKGTALCSINEIQEIPTISKHCNQLYNIIDREDKSSQNYFKIDHIIENVDCSDNIESFQDVILKNKKAFAVSDDDVGLIKDYQHHIELMDNIPVACKPFRTPHSKIQIIEDEIKRLKKCGIIRESTSAYAAPCLIVYKKSGAPRLVIDFRRLNQKIVPIRYPLPLLESSLQLLGGNKYFSSLDLLSGYHQIPIREEDKHKTAFSSGRGLHEFNRVPFGMITSGAAMQYTMERVLGEYNNTIALCYIDDIICYGRTIEEHDKNLGLILHRLAESGFKLNARKCHFRKTRIECLGHILTQDGIQPHPSKIEAVKNKPRPRNVKEVQSFIGLCSYYRRFVHQFSKIAKPIVDLVKKSSKFVWSNECDEAFYKLKEALIQAPILTHPDYEKCFYITTDGSLEGIGGVMTQIVNNKHMPVAYYSRTLNNAEKKYNPYEIEGLAIKACLQKWRYHVLGYPIIVRSDNQPVISLLKKGNCEGRVAKYLSIIQEFNPSYEYIPGVKNQMADYLSRNTEQPNIVHRIQDDKLELPSVQQLAKEQKQDPFYEEFIKNNRFITKQDLLYKIQNSELKLYVPQKYIKDYILYFHHKLCAHSGMFRTFQRLKTYVYFPKLRDHVRKVVNDCQICKSGKPDFTRKTPIGEYPETHKPFSRIHLDLIGPLPNAPSNFKYIFIAIDSFSHFIITEAITRKDSARICNIVQDKILDKFEIPDLIVTDRGSEFSSNAFQKFCNDRNIKIHLCAPYHKESNGLVERANLQVEMGLRCAIIEKGKSWVNHLQYVTEALNNSIHANMPFTPNEVINNRREKIYLPGILTHDANLCKNNRELFNKVKVSLKKHKKRWFTRSNRNRKNKVIEINDMVFYKNPDINNKMQKVYLGPCEVIRKNNDFSFVLLDKEKVEHIVHRNYIKL